MNYCVKIDAEDVCDSCFSEEYTHIESHNILTTFFHNVSQYIKDASFDFNETIQYLKLTELIYLMLMHNSCCIKNKILNSVDRYQDTFEKIINDSVFKNVSIDHLAQKCNRSLSAFKKEFKDTFMESPHKWFTKKRLLHSKLLLISTKKSISEIGQECNFPNTSHFIKLFKKEFLVTPAVYRQNKNQELSMKSNKTTIMRSVINENMVNVI